MRILIIEDSYVLADTLVSQFDKEQITADIADDGNQGYEYLSSGIYDAAVLDLMLPGMNGFEVLQKLRGEGNTTPVIVLSAMSELDDKVTAFEYGADDYLTKPFKFKELLMRVRAIVRRQTTSNTYLLSCGDLNLDLNTCIIFNKSRNLSTNLSKKEFQLLEYLLSNQNQVVTREQIAEKIWGFDSNTEYNNVEVYISFLRKKIAYIQSNAQIRVIRGIGYMMEDKN